MTRTSHSESIEIDRHDTPPALPIHQQDVIQSQETVVRSSMEVDAEKLVAGIVWFIIISIIIVVIVLGTIGGTFVMPSVEMAGVSNSPVDGGSQLTISGSTFNINFGLIISVNNPNMLNIDLTDITATAYYPNQNGKGHTKIGGGYLAEYFVPTYSNNNFTFSFAIQYNPTLDTDQSILNDLASKCGLTGEEKRDITVEYTIHLTAKVLFIKVNPTISSSATFACPISSNGAITGLGDGTLSGS
ncbi:hypothetical protein G6F57_002786 [Rhizopus arrhizus]|nr:hypothetical protein G6F30_003893 [Rhizopus arrhizus]KAG0985167.1 hypothetical protein G6F29_004228 [Rhizopus arrhizus]KAG0996849.1 hypothetical protein G6F28_003454 [Rhizopus arrhizus]KAG1010763.1 hypothetical protein G6F27_004363 [Rhizopus arrhizus]KAG1027190.1 hypothetical protein G6F26_003649 [Rhizopus arrhizus]